MHMQANQFTGLRPANKKPNLANASVFRARVSVFPRLSNQHLPPSVAPNALDPEFLSHLESGTLQQLEQHIQTVIETWPGMENLTTAAVLQPLLDALSTITSAGQGSFDPYIASGTLDIWSLIPESASPHMGSAAALSALDSLSSWASAALGSSQKAASEFASISLNIPEGGINAFLSEGLSSSTPAEGSNGALLSDVFVNLGGALTGLRSAVEAMSASGETSPDVQATLSALTSTLSAVTASLGSLLDASSPPVDMGKLLAGLAVDMGSGMSGTDHDALLQNPMVATISAAAFMVVVAIAEAVEAKRGLGEADKGSREAALALMQAERAAQARSILLKEGCYCPEKLAEYFENRPVLVAKRAAQVAAEAAGLGAALALDFATGTVQQNEKERASQMRAVIERLGPAYVKVAQALSTRVDLLSPAYFEQIQLLQDRVPPFPTGISRTVLETSLGRPVEAMFEMLSERPVAAASLGQVYYGVSRKEYGGGEVAVKVQRPGVLEAVALDLMLIRSLAVALKPQIRVDWAAIIDAWALRFFHEMDYSWEARAMNTFAKQMAPLKGIMVTEAVEDLCSDEVLTTGWIRGEKLSESNAPDVRQLCNSLLNAYLVQLLETGFLHADPHPGNLMRSNDGRLVILDFGLMTEVTEEQRGALISYIAHLSTEDWAALAYDLQALGFIPKNVDPSEAGLVEPLGKIMKQLTGGGGAAKVNIDKVVDELDQLGKDYPFEIPPFFALILRAFSVIEGIALGVDPDYAIVKECFPYLSRRLLNDDSPRTKALLREVLYGRQGRKRLDIERLARFAEGLSAYTTDALTKQVPSNTSAQSTNSIGTFTPTPTSTPTSPSATSPSSSAFLTPNVRPQTALAPIQSPPSPPASSPAVDPAVREALLVVFSRKGSYIQELLIDELVAAADALSREASSNLLHALLSSLPLTATQALLNSLGPVRGVLVPVPSPVDVLQSMSRVVAVTEEDQEALQVVRGILSLAVKAMSVGSGSGAQVSRPPQGAFGGNSSPSVISSFGPNLDANKSSSFGPSLVANQRSLARASEEWIPLLAELLPGVAHTGELFVRALLSRLASRLSQSLAGTTTWPQPGLQLSSDTTSLAIRRSNDRDGTITVDRMASTSSSSSSNQGASSMGRDSSSSSPQQSTPSKRAVSSSYEAPPLPRGRYAPYSPPGGGGNKKDDGDDKSKGWVSTVFDAAQWLIGGGARIAAGGIAPRRPKAEQSKDVKEGKGEGETGQQSRTKKGSSSSRSKSSSSGVVSK